MTDVGVILLLGVLAAAVIAIVAQYVANQVAAEAMVKDFIWSQRKALAIARRQMVIVDQYGHERTERWQKEAKYFVAKVVPAHLSKIGCTAYWASKTMDDRDWAAFVDTTARKGADELPATGASLADVTSGSGYERWCEERLQEAGWATSLTKATGDQGVDIIAARGTARVVVQCKFYTKPVGNKAVQEVVAARMHEQADAGVVVTNASFTRSAKELASTTNATLIHHDEIPDLATKLGLATA